MKFLMAVLALQLIAEWIGNKQKDKKLEDAERRNEPAPHPAEFELR